VIEPDSSVWRHELGSTKLEPIGPGAEQHRVWTNEAHLNLAAATPAGCVRS